MSGFFVIVAKFGISQKVQLRDLDFVGVLQLVEVRKLHDGAAAAGVARERVLYVEIASTFWRNLYLFFFKKNQNSKIRINKIIYYFFEFFQKLF